MEWYKKKQGEESFMMKSLKFYFILFLFTSGFSSLFGCTESESEISNTQSQSLAALNIEITDDIILTAYASRDPFPSSDNLYKVRDTYDELTSPASFFY